MILRFGLQTSLCNLCREVYNETKAGCFLSVFAVALLAEGVDRNFSFMPLFFSSSVALLAEGVDRNLGKGSNLGRIYNVALLAEGVDRNGWDYNGNSNDEDVALLAEGVDRNCKGVCMERVIEESPSSRRAWIEI